MTYAGRERGASAFVVRVELERESFFVVRLVVIPLMLIVMLSWSVFWMERSSLPDRISVSFIGILTAVTYQIVVSEIQPHISYVTLTHGFLDLSLLIMCATVVINVLAGALDKHGKVEAGDRVDRRCRWAFQWPRISVTREPSLEPCVGSEMSKVAVPLPNPTERHVARVAGLGCAR